MSGHVCVAVGAGVGAGVGAAVLDVRGGWVVKNASVPVHLNTIILRVG